jgi:membrane fusion protein (multidrug efflux system)
MNTRDRLPMTCCLALLSLLASGCRTGGPGPAAGPLEVTTVTVARRDVPIQLEYVGQAESSRLVEIRARIDGYLQKMAYAEGTIVKTGALLFQIDPRPLQLLADGARAALQDKENWAANAHQNLERLKPLFAQNAVAKKDYDDAIAADKSAQANLQAARAEDARAQLNLGYAHVTSPLTGLAGRTNLAEGTYINPAGNGLLTTVAQIDPIYVNFSISEDEKLRFDREAKAGTLRYPLRGQFDVTMVLSDGQPLASQGKINFAAPSVDTQTGAYAIRATFPNADLGVRPGQFVRVKVKGMVRTNAILVPQRAVMQGQAGKFVYVVARDGKAELRPVTVGDWQGDDWFVTDGLQGGEQLVVGGVVKVAPGAPLKPSPEPAAPVAKSR